MSELRWFGVGRSAQVADESEDDFVPIGEEHGWWADRDELSGVPHGRTPSSPATDDGHSQTTRRRYWSPESIYEESGRLPPEDPDPYEILGIPRGASLAEAAAARRRIAKECHPDLSHEDPATWTSSNERMRRANEAFEELRRAG